MTSPTQRRKAQVNAVVALLQALTEEQLAEVLASLAARGVVALDGEGTKPKRVCGICTLPFALCRQRWAHDHDFELTTK